MASIHQMYELLALFGVLLFLIPSFFSQLGSTYSWQSLFSWKLPVGSSFFGISVLVVQQAG
ncbi:hypothetical protein B0H11DRAFT_1980473 [Mycena galericulata]|nr:hypothetical protein B0H11DRAFT_1983369 [Mycena galericulata]KAJ7504665.1 hypothetical protein B0H11DRAFT_1980473 [Mycena galericulata]